MKNFGGKNFMTFTEALAQMAQGKVARRHGFKDQYFIDPQTGEFTIHLVRYDKKTKTTKEKNITYGHFTLFVNNIKATDWEIVEEEPKVEEKTDDK
jgi:hypothetical protein